MFGEVSHRLPVFPRPEWSLPHFQGPGSWEVDLGGRKDGKKCKNTYPPSMQRFPTEIYN